MTSRLAQIVASGAPQSSGTNKDPQMAYTRLGRSGLKISKVILGAMSYGDPSQGNSWSLPEDQALPLLYHAYKRGINTWDTADAYGQGTSESIIGKAIKEHQIPRSNLVILSKCFFGTYIDVLQIHRLDHETPPEEIMRALNDVVESGKVRYIGASSMAAWELQMLNNVAASKNYHQFISMQNYHNLIYREEEREMHPYCDFAGIGLIPWSPLATGILAQPWSEMGATKRAQDNQFLSFMCQEEDKAIVDKLEEVNKRLGKSMASVAIAWSLQKGVNPILGLSSVERIDEAVETIGLELSEDDVRALEEPYRARAVAPMW